MAICSANGGAGWIPVTDPFPSGQDTIPVHPNCRCSVIYRQAEAEQVTSLALGTVLTVNCPDCGRRMPVNNLEGRAEGPPDPKACGARRGWADQLRRGARDRMRMASEAGAPPAEVASQRAPALSIPLTFGGCLRTISSTAIIFGSGPVIGVESSVT